MYLDYMQHDLILLVEVVYWTRIWEINAPEDPLCIANGGSYSTSVYFHSGP